MSFLFQTMRKKTWFWVAVVVIGLTLLVPPWAHRKILAVPSYDISPLPSSGSFLMDGNASLGHNEWSFCGLSFFWQSPQFDKQADALYHDHLFGSRLYYPDMAISWPVLLVEWVLILLFIWWGNCIYYRSSVSSKVIESLLLTVICFGLFYLLVAYPYSPNDHSRIF